MRLRQIVIVARDLDAIESRIAAELGVELCYRDPQVAVFGLRNALFPIGRQFLEVVTPIEDGTTAGRLLDKRGGDGGYMVLLEVDDLGPVRARLLAAGVRIVLEAPGDGILGLHLHPADLGGAIVSIDETETWGEWPWAGPAWRDHVRTDVVAGVVAVVIEATDPAAMAGRWSAALGRAVDDDGTGPIISLDEGELRFVPQGECGEGVAGFVLRAADGADPIETTIGGCRFTSIR